jgi:hypothetical protein
VNDSPEKKRTVRVTRRRSSGATAPQDRERAQAPRRRRSDDRGQTPPPSRAGRVPSGGQAPSLLPGLISLAGSRGRSAGGGRGRLLLIIGVLAVICVCVAILVLSSLPESPGEGVYVPPAPVDDSSESFVPQEPTTPSEPFVPPATSSEGQSWLVMLYQDADDKILEQDIYLDLNEAERVGSSDRVHVVTQIDRYAAGYQGDGNWSTTKRFYVTQDNDLTRLGSQFVEDLGEVNMADGATLVDFATWAIETFPADHHVLILSDHGLGWPGGWSDPAPGGVPDRSIPISSAMGDELYLMELDQALEEIRARTGVEQFELIGLDACLMGHLEVLTALAPHARYAVASQETEPALGWAYTAFLRALQRNPDIDGADLGRLIVDSYIQDDQRVVDNQARAEFLRQGSPMGGLFSPYADMTAEQLAEQLERSITLTAVDLAALPDLLNSVNDLAYTLQGERQSVVARGRAYAQSFTSVFGRTIPPSYIDLGNFCQLLRQETGNREVAQAAEGVLSSLSRAIIAEKHGPQKPGATGISIYFPNSQLFQSPVAGPQSYTAVADRFAEQSLWDDFLVFHYTGRPFEQAARVQAVPEQGAPVSAPGKGEIEVSPIRISENVVAPGGSILLSADIDGQNIGYVRLFVGFYDAEANSILVADTDYLDSAETREIDGVYYPEWGEGAFTMEFEWEPIVFAINDGTDSVVALLSPQTYGASSAEAIYTVDGVYTYADGGESRYARMYFSDGLLLHTFGFTGEGGAGAPREIIPQPGDSFTVLERWLDLDARGSVVQESAQTGGTLVFGDQNFVWEEMYAAAGDYIVGFIVEDLDGNPYQVYEQVRVE